MGMHWTMIVPVTSELYLQPCQHKHLGVHFDVPEGTNHICDMAFRPGDVSDMHDQKLFVDRGYLTNVKLVPAVSVTLPRYSYS